MYKNIEKQAVLQLKDLVEYQTGQVVSKTLVQNESVSITLFCPFDKRRKKISTHESGGDAFVTCLDGTGEITIDGVKLRTPRRRIHRHAGKTSACSVWQRAV